MAKKFDTNPLDPKFPEKVKEAETTGLPNTNGQTRQFADPADTEEQTRKFNRAEFDPFGTPFGQEGNPPANYQPAHIYQKKPDSLKIGSVSLPENVLITLPYIPFMIGLVAGLIELFLIPKSEPKVRYHAAQGVAAHLGILIVTTILGFASIATDLADTAKDIFSLVTIIILIVFAVKAWQGKPIHIEAVESLTDWLEEKIKPQS